MSPHPAPLIDVDMDPEAAALAAPAPDLAAMIAFLQRESAYAEAALEKRLASAPRCAEVERRKRAQIAAYQGAIGYLQRLRVLLEDPGLPPEYRWALLPPPSPPAPKPAAMKETNHGQDQDEPR